MKPKKFRPVPKNANKGVYSVLLFFVGFFLLLSAWTKYMFGPAYLFVLLGGLPFFYGFPVIVFVFAGNLNAKKPMSKKTGWRLFAGYVVFLLGLILLFSAIGYGDKNGIYGASDFKSHLDAVIAGQHQTLLGSDLALGGGLLGYSIVGLFKDGLKFVPWVIAIVLILAGIVTAIFPLIKKQFALMGEKKEKEEVMPVLQDRGDDDPNEIEPEMEEPIAIAQHNFEEDPKISEEKVNEPEPEEKEIEIPPTPMPIPTPSINFAHEVEVTKADGPVLRMGLSEAFFDIDGTGYVAPVAAKPASSNEAVFKPTSSAQEYGEIKLDNEEETPDYAKAPSFVPESSLQRAPVEETQSAPIQEETPAEEEAVEEEQKGEVPFVIIRNEITDTPPAQEEEVAPSEEPEPYDEEAIEEEYEEEPDLLNEQYQQSVAASVPPARPAPSVKKPEPQPEPEHIAEPTILVGWHWAEERPDYEFPSMDVLKEYDNSSNLAANTADCEAKKESLNQTLDSFSAGAHVISYTIGPSVTRYDVKCDAGVSVSSLSKIMDDIRQSLNGLPVHFEKVITGKTTAGLEVQNSVSSFVGFKDILTRMPERNEDNTMLIPFGETISGEYKFADLTEFPHLLVAGTTGSGKSIFIHGLLLSLLMRNRPEDCKFVLVDPKRVEMTKYKNLPHLLCPIIQEPQETQNCLEKLCDEMEMRYKVFEAAGCRDIREFNNEYADQHKVGRMPFIVVVVDEYADIVEQAKDVSIHVGRLCAKARAAGIHLVIATQRPSVNVINGVIKGNIATRVALKVSSGVDSNVILDQIGAEDLIGHGDMLVKCDRIQVGATIRMQGCIVTSSEIRAVTDHIRAHAETKFNPAFLDLTNVSNSSSSSKGEANPPITGPSPAEMKAASDNEKYEWIKENIMQREFTSISQIQREFGVGFPRAGKIFAQLQKEGIVDTNPISSSRGCRVLIKAENFESQDNPGSTDQNTVISSPFGKE